MTTEVQPSQQITEADLEQKFDQLKSIVATLRSRNAILADENNSLKTQIEAIRSEVGGKLFDSRVPMSELMNTMDRLRDALAKKLDSKTARDIAGGKPLRIMVAEVGTSASEKLAKELLERGDMPLTVPKIEEL